MVTTMCVRVCSVCRCVGRSVWMQFCQTGHTIWTDRISLSVGRPQYSRGLSTVGLRLLSCCLYSCCVFQEIVFAFLLKLKLNLYRRPNKFKIKVYRLNNNRVDLLKKIIGSSPDI